MVQQYTVFGRQVGSHVLSMITLGVTFGASYLVMGRSKSKDLTQDPPINAKSKEEETFIREFIKGAEAKNKSKAAR